MAGREKQRCLEILGLPFDASEDDIKRKYRTLAKQHHPDKNDDEGATQRFQEISCAYKFLIEGPQHNFEDAESFENFDIPVEVLIRLFPWLFGGRRIFRPTRVFHPAGVFHPFSFFHPSEMFVPRRPNRASAFNIYDSSDSSDSDFEYRSWGSKQYNTASGDNNNINININAKKQKRKEKRKRYEEKRQQAKNDERVYGGTGGKEKKQEADAKEYLFQEQNKKDENKNQEKTNLSHGSSDQENGGHVPDQSERSRSSDNREDNSGDVKNDAETGGTKQKLKDAKTGTGRKSVAEKIASSERTKEKKKKILAEERKREKEMREIRKDIEREEEIRAQKMAQKKEQERRQAEEKKRREEEEQQREEEEKRQREEEEERRREEEENRRNEEEERRRKEEEEERRRAEEQEEMERRELERKKALEKEQLEKLQKQQQNASKLNKKINKKLVRPTGNSFSVLAELDPESNVLLETKTNENFSTPNEMNNQLSNSSSRLDELDDISDNEELLQFASKNSFWCDLTSATSGSPDDDPSTSKGQAGKKTEDRLGPETENSRTFNSAPDYRHRFQAPRGFRPPRSRGFYGNRPPRVRGGFCGYYAPRGSGFCGNAETGQQNWAYKPPPPPQPQPPPTSSSSSSTSPSPAPASSPTAPTPVKSWADEMNDVDDDVVSSPNAGSRSGFAWSSPYDVNSNSNSNSHANSDSNRSNMGASRPYGGNSYSAMKSNGGYGRGAAYSRGGIYHQAAYQSHDDRGGYRGGAARGYGGNIRGQSFQNNFYAGDNVYYYQNRGNPVRGYFNSRPHEAKQFSYFSYQRQ